MQTVDERLSIYGWETGTGVKFAIVVDYYGREGLEEGGIGVNIKDGDLKPVSEMQKIPKDENERGTQGIGRLQILTGPHRHSGHCRQHTSDYCKIPFTHRIITHLWKWPWVRGRVEKLRVVDSYKRLRGLVWLGSRALKRYKQPLQGLRLICRNLWMANT